MASPTAQLGVPCLVSRFVILHAKGNEIRYHVSLSPVRLLLLSCEPVACCDCCCYHVSVSPVRLLRNQVSRSALTYVTTCALN
jgi:hypothetical protein